LKNSPVVWTIAGSDSGGGAGIQTDLKVMNAFGVHGCSVITALTAQNTLGVQSTESVSEAMIRNQLDALHNDLPPGAVKTGMLGSTATCKVLAEVFQSLDAPIVCDPVLASTSGTDLLDPEALDILVHGIFPQVDVLTPNLPEAGSIIGADIQNIEDAAGKILELGARSVLIKGGHAADDACSDYWTDGKESMWLSSPRIDTTATHGTGCVLSAAIASAIALGQDIQESIITAKTFLNQCLKSPANIGEGAGPMRIEPFRDDPKCRPHVVGGIGDPEAGQVIDPGYKNVKRP
jgi:hydroxymethylpyrimidine kinase/phosphomethylpyrimidine kinase/thiamine-phosphate diphosphorylase